MEGIKVAHMIRKQQLELSRQSAFQQFAALRNNCVHREGSFQLQKKFATELANSTVMADRLLKSTIAQANSIPWY